MDNPRVFARQSNTVSGHNRAPEARSAGREGLEQPDRVLYVYDRVSTKNAMQRRMESIPLENHGTDLSGVYKKKAHIHTDMNRNLKQFYGADKQNRRKPVYMGKVVDENTRAARTDEHTRSADAAHTQSFDSVGQNRRTRNAGAYANPVEKQRYAAFDGRETFGSWPDDGQTRVFRTPETNTVPGGAAVKKRRGKIPDILISFFENIEERWHSDVDTAKKQALLHKKLQEHRKGLMLALVILLVFGLCCTAIYELFFVVRNIDVSGSERYTAGQVISAAGLGEDTNLYDFRASDVTDRITFYCPYIKSADLSRKLPATVSLTLEDDRAMYCANIFGEIVALSPGLRVLGTIEAEEASGCILLRLPDVTEAVAGRTVVFTDVKDERYIRLVLEEITVSALNGRISFMDLRDDHDIRLHCDGMYELQLGTSTDLKMKLRMADTAIADPMFPQNTPARVDLSVVSEASVRADIRLDLAVTP